MSKCNCDHHINGCVSAELEKYKSIAGDLAYAIAKFRSLYIHGDHVHVSLPGIEKSKLEKICADCYSKEILTKYHEIIKGEK